MPYSLDVTEILPLKAFYLGFSLKDNLNLDKVESMITKSIDMCEGEEKHKHKKIFYLLLDCEIHREKKNFANYRKVAKVFCKEKNLETYFENYLKIVNKTLSTKKVYGGGKFSVVKQEEVSDEEWIFQGVSYYPGVGLGGHWARLDSPLEALGLKREHLTEKDLWFLYKVGLSYIIEKHFGERVGKI